MQWLFPDISAVPDDEEIVAIAGEVTADSIIAGYRAGVFPMHVPLHVDGVDTGSEVLAWFCPSPRGILPLNQLRVTRSLGKSYRRYSVTINESFDEVLAACANPERDGRWITDDFVAAYRELHRRGLAHSVETRIRTSTGDIVGGLIAVENGGLVCGDTMFYRERDASKVALVALVHMLAATPGDDRLPGGRLLDVQWATDHLMSLGAVEMPRAQYLELLPHALAVAPTLSGS